MKKRIYIIRVLLSITVLIFIACLSGCNKDLLFENLTGIYLDKAAIKSSTDSLSYSFAEKEDTRKTDTILLAVKIMGDVSSQDRVIPLMANASKTTATAGTHFTILPSVIKANESTGYAQIVLNRTADLKDQQFRIYLEIVANQDFPDLIQATKTNSTINGNPSQVFYSGYLIKLTDQILKPESWDNSGSWFRYYFGSYSEVKYKFIIQVTGRTIWGEGARYGDDAPSSLEMQQYYSKLVTALYAYEQEHGPMIDENGNQVTFPNL